MTAPGLVISTDTSTCVSISQYPSSQNAEPLLASNRPYKGFHLEAHVSFEHAKPRKPWYLIWKQMSTSNSSRSPISRPHSDFEPDALEIRESLGDLTSPQHRHRRANRRRNLDSWVPFLISLFIFVWSISEANRKNSWMRGEQACLEKFTQMLCYWCWLCFCQFLKFGKYKSIGCFINDVARYHNSEVVTSHYEAC